MSFRRTGSPSSSMGLPSARRCGARQRRRPRARQIRAFNNRSFNAGKAVATVVLRNEDFGRLTRILTDGLHRGVRNQHRQSHLSGRRNIAYNIDRRDSGHRQGDQIVMLGGHLDSWHAATGATDNAIGCAIGAPEALDVKPRRTIPARVVEWRRTGRWIARLCETTLRHGREPEVGAGPTSPGISTRHAGAAGAGVDVEIATNFAYSGFGFSTVPKCSFTYACDPSSPCSSPLQSATRIVRRGFTPIAWRMRAASIITAQPMALSVAPVAECHESRWPPSITTSSALSVPGISAIALYACSPSG